MNYITTTELRTKSSELIQLLLAGEPVSLIHRSKIVGVIEPKEGDTKVFKKTDVEKLNAIMRAMNLPKTTPAQRERIYRQHLMQKYGQTLSGR